MGARTLTHNKTLKDIQIRNPSGLKNLMAHVKVVDNNLILEFDFDHGRFALSAYLQLKDSQKFGSKEFLSKLEDLEGLGNDLA